MAQKLNDQNMCWTYEILCGTVVYCEGGAEMARVAVQAEKLNKYKISSDSTSTLVDVGSLFSYAEEGLG